MRFDEGWHMRPRILGLSVFLACLACIGGSAKADSITVQNGNFETAYTSSLTNCGTGCAINAGPVPSWTSAPGTIEVGSWQLGAGNGYFTVPLSGGGNTVAYVLKGTLEQDLGVTLAPDTTYTLTVLVGDRSDHYLAGSYLIGLDAGSNPLCSFGGTDTSIPGGTFAQETCSFTTGSLPPSGDLIVLLSGVGGETQFDNVTVTTPEPAAIALLAAGLIFVGTVGLFFRRKQGLAS